MTKLSAVFLFNQLGKARVDQLEPEHDYGVFESGTEILVIVNDIAMMSESAAGS